MHTPHIWHSIHISMFKKIVFLLLFFVHFVATAQVDRMHNPEHDTKAYYFGISIGLNMSQFKIKPTKYFIDNDTVKNMTPLWKPGFQLGIMGNLRLSNFVDARAIPSFMLREKALRFDLQNDSVTTSSFESILFHLPIEFKFKSDRQTNFRFYVCSGIKFDYDFNANARSKRTDEILKVKAFDFGYNLGLGFEFYYPNFIFAPEIKLTNGLGNIISRNATEPTNKAIDRISTRMIIISFHIQG